MTTLDITTIIIAALAILSTIVSGIIGMVKSKRNQESKNDAEQGKLINELSLNQIKKQCRAINNLVKEIKELRKDVNEKLFKKSMK